MSATERQHILVGALKTRAGEWLTRQQLARQLGHKTLSHADTVLLDILARDGEIEARRVKSNAPSGERAEYRVKG